MSELTVWERAHGLGPFLDAIEGVEGKIVSAVQANPQAVAGETIAIEDAGNLVKAAFIGAVAKAFPGATQIATAIVTPAVTAGEKIAESIIGIGTTTPPA